MLKDWFDNMVESIQGDYPRSQIADIVPEDQEAGASSVLGESSRLGDTSAANHTQGDTKPPSDLPQQLY